MTTGSITRIAGACLRQPPHHLPHARRSGGNQSHPAWRDEPPRPHAPRFPGRRVIPRSQVSLGNASARPRSQPPLVPYASAPAGEVSLRVDAAWMPLDPAARAGVSSRSLPSGNMKPIAPLLAVLSLKPPFLCCKGREKLAKLLVFARAQRSDRRFIHRVTVSRHLRRLHASDGEHCLDLLVREDTFHVDSSRKLFEKFRVVETAQVFEVSRDPVSILTREFGQFVDDRVAGHGSRMPAVRSCSSARSGRCVCRCMSCRISRQTPLAHRRLNLSRRIASFATN